MMNHKPSPTGKRVSPVAMLEGRASFAYLDGVAIVLTDVEKWTDEDVMRLITKQAELVGYISAKSNITHFFATYSAPLIAR